PWFAPPSAPSQSSRRGSLLFSGLPVPYPHKSMQLSGLAETSRISSARVQDEGVSWTPVSPPRSVKATSPTTPPPSRGPDGIQPLFGPPGALFPPLGRSGAWPNRAGATGLPQPRAPHGAARGRSPRAHDAGGEGGTDDVPLERQAADRRRPGA